MVCEVVGYVMAFSFSQGKWFTLELQNCYEKRRDVNRAIIKETGKEAEFYPVKANGKVIYIIKEQG